MTTTLMCISRRKPSRPCLTIEHISSSYSIASSTLAVPTQLKNTCGFVRNQKRYPSHRSRRLRCFVLLRLIIHRHRLHFSAHIGPTASVPLFSVTARITTTSTSKPTKNTPTPHLTHFTFSGRRSSTRAKVNELHQTGTPIPHGHFRTSLFHARENSNNSNNNNIGTGAGAI